MLACCLLFRIPSQGNAWLERGRESRLVIDNVTYDYQGEYECRASNFINGQERSTTSDPISLQVVGAPQVLRPNSSGYQVAVKRGESASLTLVIVDVDVNDNSFKYLFSKGGVCGSSSSTRCLGMGFITLGSWSGHRYEERILILILCKHRNKEKNQ